MTSPWIMTPYEALESPAVAVLFYHNVYEEGKQGGLEIIQQGTRVAGNGNLRLGSAPEQWAALPGHGPRRIDRKTRSMQVTCQYPGQGIRYAVRLQPEGNSLRLTIDLPKPLPAEWVGKTSFNLELMPGAVMGKTYFLDATSGIFPRQYNSPFIPDPQGSLEPQPLARGKKLTITPEDSATRLEIEALRSEIVLLDGRGYAQNGWFIARSLVPAEATQGAIEWRITPTIVPGWIRPPVIGFSQVGYHLHQKKVAAIELDAQVMQPGEARLVRIDPTGEQVVKVQNPSLWGAYLCYHYAQFDFTEVRQPGMYRIEYESRSSEVFPIHEAVYERDVWQPTLEGYFPVQMCHVEVRDAYRVWHGACHLDDALQAPINYHHPIDGYVQYEGTETPYAPMEYIPHLDVGGWHDAGDYDLAAGSQAHTTHVLALVRETFGIDSDQTTVEKSRRQVVMHVPDGVPDIVQQVTHGVENLLSGYRAAGHSLSGIIENSLRQYVHLGEPALITDNRVSSGLPIGQSDDRWAFTSRDTALEYQVCAALAASSRVLCGWEEVLADECLETARKAWKFEHSHPVKTARSAYVPGNPELQEVIATAELLITTGEEPYRQALLAQADRIVDNIQAAGWVAARALAWVKDAAFEASLRTAVKAYGKKAAAEAQQNPFGVPYPSETWRKDAPVWGIAWGLLERAVNFYYLHKAFPDLVSRDLVTDILGYVLGCHPVSNASLVSGVGAKSLTIAYGINRADWTYQPGGVVSGPTLLQPNYPELLDPFPFLWMQKEYVISGAANYIFIVLAANELMRERE